MSDPARTTPDPSQVRLILKPGMPRTGAVDGAWWPHSRDLVAEVPALVAAVPAAAGRVQRVGFGRSMWDAVPQRIRGWADGRRIGLDGFAAFAADVVWIATSITGSAPLFLLVVPPDTAPDVADGISCATWEAGSGIAQQGIAFRIRRGSDRRSGRATGWRGGRFGS